MSIVIMGCRGGAVALALWLVIISLERGDLSITAIGTFQASVQIVAS